MRVGLFMGHVFVKVKLRGRDVVELDKVLVDIGASFTVMPLDLAEKYLVETPFTAELRLGDGRVIEARVFVAECEIEGRKGPVRVLAFKNAMPVIGIDTLETLGLKVDPVTGKIEKTEYYMLYV